MTIAQLIAFRGYCWYLEQAMMRDGYNYQTISNYDRWKDYQDMRVAFQGE